MSQVREPVEPNMAETFLSWGLLTGASLCAPKSAAQTAAIFAQNTFCIPDRATLSRAVAR